MLDEIREELEQLNEKFDVLIDGLKTGKDGRSIPALNVATLLYMPDHLRSTLMAVARRGPATADRIAEETQRTRAVESAHLNQLVVMGYITKERKGRTVYFYT